MITLPRYFERAVKGKSTSLTTFVHIYKNATTDIPIDQQDLDYDQAIKLSNRRLTIENQSNNQILHYSEILKKTPKIQDTLDIVNSEHTISSSNLEIFNTVNIYHLETEHECQLSDIIKDYLGSVVQIYYAVENTKYLQDAVLLYTGVIKRYDQKKDAILLQLEDLSSIKYSVNIPAQLMPFDDTVREKDRGMPYPMCYGYMRYAPTRQKLVDLTGDGNFTLESFVIDRPEINLGGVIQANDEYDLNPDLKNYQHDLNYYQFTPFSRDNQNNPYDRDYLYIYDEDFLHINKIATEKLGISYVATNNEDITPFVELFLNTGTQLYYFDAEQNQVRFMDSYFYQMTELHTKWASMQEIEGDAEENNAYQEIDFEPDYIFTRIYRPITKVVFYANKTTQDNYDTKVNFFGVTNKNNDGVQWLPYANVDANQDYLPAGTSFTDQNTTEEQYELNWDYGNEKNWWRCDAIRTASATPFGQKTTGNIDDNWYANDMSGSYTGERGEFPVEYIQNGNYNTGLYIEAETIDDDRSEAYATFQMPEYRSDLRCETKVIMKLAFYQDVQTDRSYESTARSNNDPTADFRHMGIFGFSVNDRPRSRMIEYVYDHSGFPNRFDGRSIENYFDLSSVFNTPYPYGPATEGNGSVEYGSDYEGLHEGYTPTQDGFGNQATNSDWITSYFVDTNWNTVNYSDHVKFVVPSYYQSGSDHEFQIISKNFLKEYYMFHDVIIDKPLTRDFYVNVAGRTSDAGEVLQNPAEIIIDIFKQEVNFTDHFRDITEALQELKDWVLGFSRLDTITLNDFMSDMFKNVLSTVRFFADGSADIFSHKRYLNNRLNVNVTEVDVRDILRYGFSLTKNDNVKNQVNVKYDYNVASKTYRKETGYSLKSINNEEFETLDDFTNNYFPNNSYSINYYNLFDNEGKLEFESQYIYDENTAKKLQRKLLLWNCNQHLIFDLRLPLKYIFLEVGDYISFSDLIDGELAFGYDYTQEGIRNGQLIYKEFIITSINKTDKDISIKCIQAHRLELGYPENYFTGGNYFENGECWSEDNINIGVNWLVPEGLTPPDEDIIEEDDWEEEDEQWIYEDFFTAEWIQTYDSDTTREKLTFGEAVAIAQNSNFTDNVFVEVRLLSVSHDVEIDGQRYEAGVEYNEKVNRWFNINIQDQNGLAHRISLDPLYDFEDLNLVIKYKVKLSDISYSFEDEQIPDVIEIPDDTIEQSPYDSTENEGGR